jgi:hypothetical protein
MNEQTVSTQNKFLLKPPTWILAVAGFLSLWLIITFLGPRIGGMLALIVLPLYIYLWKRARDYPYLWIWDVFVVPPILLTIPNIYAMVETIQQYGYLESLYGFLYLFHIILIALLVGMLLVRRYVLTRGVKPNYPNLIHILTLLVLVVGIGFSAYYHVHEHLRWKEHRAETERAIAETRERMAAQREKEVAQEALDQAVIEYKRSSGQEQN